MARFGQFMKDQLLPEDPLDWIIMILVLAVAIGCMVLLVIMVSFGLV